MHSKHFITFVAAVTTAAWAAPTTPAATFNNMLSIILENTDYKSAIADPNLSAFASSGILFSNWLAITHPSQPNYIAMTSGSRNGVFSDFTTTVNAKNVADLLEAQGLTWKSYQENWPGSCFTGTKSLDGLYVRKHNPFISYSNIQKNPSRCANIVDSSHLAADIAANNLPNFAWYTPNIKNDGHDTNITFAGNWLKGFLGSSNILEHFDIVLLTFDETESFFSRNQVFTAIAGKAVTSAGKTDDTALSHYSVLATLEKNFELGNLGANDVKATPFSF